MLTYFEDALSFGLRPVLKGAIHKKYITQQGFAYLAKTLNKESGRYVCAYLSSELSNLREQINSLPSTVKILFIGGSDQSFRHKDLRNLSFSGVIYAQNLIDKATKRVRFLPIGVEDISKARNSLCLNCGCTKIPWDKRDPRLLVGPFRATNPIRKDLLNSFSTCSSVNLQDSRLSVWEYDSLVRRHKYVLCPPGNGPDTHRFWETIIRGSIPVVLKSQLTEHYRATGASFIAVNSLEPCEIRNAIASHCNSPSAIPDIVEVKYWKRVLELVLGQNQ